MEKKERSALIKKEEVSRNRVVSIREASTKGTLVRRVKPDGSFVGNDTLIVAGAYVSGSADDPDFIKYVVARELDKKGKISNKPPLHYDPSLTVVKIGYIDYLDPKNANFFKSIDAKY